MSFGVREWVAKRLAWVMLVTSFLVSIVGGLEAPPAFAAAVPIINTQPSPVNPSLGANFNLTVSANVTDGGTLTYQWYKRATTSDSPAAMTNTGNVTGATTASLSITSATATNGGLYYVVITNTLNGSTSTKTSDEVSVYVGLQYEGFTGTSLSAPSNWVMTYGAISPCLTAVSGNAPTGGGTVTTSSMPGCQNISYSATVDPVGQGALRLVHNAGDQRGYALYNVARSTSNGLDISFYQSQWGASGNPGDGLSLFLKDGADTINDAGYSGGALGYAPYAPNTDGISNALFGIGFDAFGNYPTTTYDGNDCSATGGSSGTYTSSITRSGVTTTRTETFYKASIPENNSSRVANNIVIRGPQGSTRRKGYCVITPNPDSPAIGTFGSTSYQTRESGAQLIRVTVEPGTFTRPQIRVYVDGVLEVVADAPLAYKDSPTFKFGFAGGTGSAYQNVDIWNLSINTFDGLTPPDPPEAVSVSATANFGGGRQTVSWSAPASWGTSEGLTGERSYTAYLFDSTGSTDLNNSCTTTTLTCDIKLIPAGNYVVKVKATNKSNISSIYSTVLSTAAFTVTQMTNYGSGACLSQADASTDVDTFTVSNYCVIRFKNGTNVNWYVPEGVASFEYLIVGGGGGGGVGRGGGGGAGGLETGTLTVGATTKYRITVGAGGGPHTSGDSTTLGTRTVAGGGGGGSHPNNSPYPANGSNGGSGGGAGMNYSGLNFYGGTGIAGQGFSGAADRTDTDTYRNTGGGGGAGGPGIAGSGGSNTEVGGTIPSGGPGKYSSITGTSVMYAPGGGGSASISVTEYNGSYITTLGGYGGEGASGGGRGSSVSSGGVETPTATNGTDNIGGGGGGSVSSNAGSGGRGVVIIRWIPIPSSSTPNNFKLYQGRTATFTTSGSSGLTRSFSWQVMDSSGVWVNVTGGTSATLTLPNVTLAMSGNRYRVVLTDSNGSYSTSSTTGFGTLTVMAFTTTTSDYALNFNGTTQYAAVANDTSVVFNDTFTAEVWVKPSASACTGECIIWGKEYVAMIKIAPNTSGMYDQYGVLFKTFFYAIDGNGVNPASATFNWVDTRVEARIGTWQHVALVKSGTTNTANGLSLYVDGKQAFVGNPYGCVSSCTSTVSTRNTFFAIGTRTANGISPTAFFSGQIDHFVLWNYARSAAQVASDLNTYDLSSQGIQAVYDFNEGQGTVAYNVASNSTATSDLNIVDNTMYRLVESTTTTNGVTITTIPRVPLNSAGGWIAPQMKSKVLTLTIGGGAGGQPDGGAGGSGGEIRYDTTTIDSGTVVRPIIGMGGRPGMYTLAWTGVQPGTDGDTSTVIIGGTTRYVAAPGKIGGYWSGTANNQLGGTGGSGGVGIQGGTGGQNLTAQTSYATPNNAPAGPTFNITGSAVNYSGGGGGGSCHDSLAAGPSQTGASGGTGGGGYGGYHIVNVGSTRGGSATGNTGSGGGAGSACSGGPTADQNQRTGGGWGGSGVFMMRYIVVSPTFTGPTGDTTTAGLTDTLTVTGSPLTGMSRSYKWIYSTDSGTTWLNVTQGTGYDTSTYVTQTLTTSMTQYQYACVVTDTDGVGLTTSDTTTAAILIVNPANLITFDSSTISQKYGNYRSSQATSQYGTGSKTWKLTPISNAAGKITFDTTSATLTIDTATLVGAYLETITVIDSKTASTNYPVTINITGADTVTVTPIGGTLTYGATSSYIETSTISPLVAGDTVTVVYQYTGTSYGGTVFTQSSTRPTVAGVYTINETITAVSNGSVTNGQLSNYMKTKYDTATYIVNRAARSNFGIVSTSSTLAAVAGTPIKIFATGVGDTTTVQFTLIAGGHASCSLDTATAILQITGGLTGNCSVRAYVPQSPNYLAETSTVVLVVFYPYVNNYTTPVSGTGPTIALPSAPSFTLDTVTVLPTITSVTATLWDTNTSSVITFTIIGTGFESDSVPRLGRGNNMNVTSRTGTTQIVATFNVGSYAIDTQIGRVSVTTSKGIAAATTSSGTNIVNGFYVVKTT